MDHVEALAKVRAAGLTAEADELEHAIDDALSDSPVVRISGGPTADQIADAVVAKLLEHTQVIGAKLVQKAAPEGVPPVPWTYSDRTERAGSLDGFVLFESLDVGCGDFDKHYCQIETLRAIVAAVNAYYAPQAPGKASTDIPDTAGYPIPDYDAVGNEVPSFGKKGGAS